MRRSIALFAFIASFVMAAAGLAQAADPPVSSSIKGLFLVTDYPSQTVRAGEITTIRVKLTNSGLPPEPVALSLADVPAGWKVDILGGGQSVASAMPGINQDISLQLRVDVPKDAKPGSNKLVLSAKGPLTQAPDLVFTLTVGTETPAKLSLKSRLPSLRGTPRSSFEYTVTVGNDSGKDLTVAL
ncbi:MAG: COG1470 family protein, partial [Reyranella sp.]